MNITTIDFDIIMEPSINFYNNKISEKESLESILKEYPFLEESFPADFFRYDYLTRYIIQAANKKIPIYFINSHKSLLKILKDKYSNENIHITNIDHHHDIGYDIDNWLLPLKELTCGNWVKYGIDKKLFHSYSWIHNENSSSPDKIAEKKYLKESQLFKDSDLTTLAKETDCLIICASYEWVPPKYHPLFMIWQSICEEINEKDTYVDLFD